LESNPLGPERGSRDEPRPERLDKYSGLSLKEHQDWIRSAGIAFRLSPKFFRTDTHRVTWASQFLRDNPREQWFTRIETQKPLEDHTWAEFETFLLDDVMDPTNRGLIVAQEFTNAIQRDNQSAHDFDAQLSHLEARLPRKEEDAKVQDFVTRLRKPLRESMMTFQTIPNTRREAVALASRIEANSSYAYGGLSNRLRPPDGKRLRRGDPPKTLGGQRERGPPYKGKSQCDRCGRTGHYRKECYALRTEKGVPLTDMPPTQPPVRPPRQGDGSAEKGKNIASLEDSKNAGATPKRPRGARK
jgi:hypothetical protein